MKKLLMLSLLVAFAGIAGAASIVPLGAPTYQILTGPHALQTYTAATALLDPVGADYTTYTSIGPVSFSATGQKRTVPTNWTTWGAPPFTETATPKITYFSGVSSVTLTLLGPVSVFGFEVEPNPFALKTYQAEFFDTLGGSMGTISWPVSGSAGARLFAGYTLDGSLSIKSVVVTNLTDSTDFAIGRVRVADIPEPGTYALMGAGLLALAGLARRRKA